MPFVLDASIAASWFFPDEDFPELRIAWDRSATDEALVPQHWWFEVRNSILNGERRNRLTQDMVSVTLEKIAVLPFTIMPRPADVAVFIIARQRRLTFYDAVYLELAKRQSVPLATLDLALAAAARAEGVSIIE